MKDEDENKAAEGLATKEGDTSLSDLEKEIDAAVEDVKLGGEDEEGEPAKEEAEAEEEPVEDVAEDLDDASSLEEEAPPEGEQGRDASGKFTKKAPFSDSLLERAVRAGIPMSEAREFTSEKLLSSTVARLEGVQKTNAEAKPGEPKKGKDGEAKPAPDSWAAAIDAIPELSTEVYDEPIVKAVAALKGIAKAQAAELAELKGKGSKDFFAEQLAGVKDFTKGDQAKESAVRAKFDALKAGYQATGTDVSDVTVFAEAAQLVLGGDMKAAAKAKTVEAAGRRSGQRISRAAGQRVAATADPVEQTAKEIDDKFFAK